MNNICFSCLSHLLDPTPGCSSVFIIRYHPLTPVPHCAPYGPLTYMSPNPHHTCLFTLCILKVCVCIYFVNFGLRRDFTLLYIVCMNSIYRLYSTEVLLEEYPDKTRQDRGTEHILRLSWDIDFRIHGYTCNCGNHLKPCVPRTKNKGQYSLQHHHG